MGRGQDLKKPSETEWVRIDEMTDEEIDMRALPTHLPALNETIRLMAEIDAAIEELGGWPIA